MFCHEFHLVDLRVYDNCLKVTSGCQHVFNLAADMGGMGFIQSNHSVILYNNTMISFNILEASRVNGVSRLFYASSACVYPEYRQMETEVEGGGLKEDTAWPAQPQDAYGETRPAARAPADRPTATQEDQARAVVALGGWRPELTCPSRLVLTIQVWRSWLVRRCASTTRQTLGSRPASAASTTCTVSLCIYPLPFCLCYRFVDAQRMDLSTRTNTRASARCTGPYGTWKGGREKAPAAFCRKVCTSPDFFEMWGDGLQTRSFTFIDDCVEGVLRLTKSDYGEPMNIGSDEMVAMNDMAQASNPPWLAAHAVVSPAAQCIRGRCAAPDAVPLCRASADGDGRCKQADPDQAHPGPDRGPRPQLGQPAHQGEARLGALHRPEGERCVAVCPVGAGRWGRDPCPLGSSMWSTWSRPSLQPDDLPFSHFPRQDGLRITYDWIKGEIDAEVARGHGDLAKYAHSMIVASTAPQALGTLRAADGQEGLQDASAPGAVAA